VFTGFVATASAAAWLNLSALGGVDASF
jgi:hypothetical protein